MNIQPIVEGEFFHIYNRGINGEDLFKEKKNYYYFLEQYKFYCADILETFAYCLLKNHFHLLVRVKKNIEVPRKDGKGMFRMDASKQLGHLFNSYSQAINKVHKRTGSLLESPFKRKIVPDEKYTLAMIHYCHTNPVRHGFVTDLREWEFSSYQSILNGRNNLVAVEKVIKLFGSIADFETFHLAKADEKNSGSYIIE